MTDLHSTDFPSIPYPWQQAEWQRLMDQRAAEKLPHAIMFAGQRGIGKRNLARALGQYLLCQSPRSGLPCGTCKACELNRADTHPDIFILEAEDKGKAIKVDQVRKLAEFVTKTSQQGGYKFAIIDPAEAMNINAANALLKSLEEPSGETVMVLLSHIPSAVMATIRSRCQILPFSTPLREQSLPWLEQLAGGSADAAALLDFANNAPLEALSMLDSDALAQRETLIKDFEGLSIGQFSPLEVASRWMSFEPIAVIEWLLRWLHGLTRYLGSRQDSFKREIPASMDGFIGHVQPQHLYRYIDKVIVLKRQVLSGANPNKQLLLEELLMDWSALIRLAGAGGQRGRNGLR